MFLHHALDCMAPRSVDRTQPGVERVAELFLEIVDNEAGIRHLSTVVRDVWEPSFWGSFSEFRPQAACFELNVCHAQVGFNLEHELTDAAKFAPGRAETVKRNQIFPLMMSAEIIE
jgi:hypothetical protein